mgnify:CR=1 FL=1
MIVPLDEVADVDFFVIIGDYRRVALYGIDRLLEDKQAQKDSTGKVMTDDIIRLREEISVADDTAAAIGIGKTRDDMGGTACSHLLVVSIEAACVMGLSVGGEELGNLGIHLIAIVGAGLLCHTDAAVGLQGALERLVGLEAYDGLLALVKVSGAMGSDGGDYLGIHIQDAAGFSFLLLEIEHLCPQILGVLGRAGKECLIAPIIYYPAKSDKLFLGPSTENS